MKVYKLTVLKKESLATLRPIQDADNKFMWDNWDITGNEICDFVPAFYHIVCKKTCVDELKNKFDGIAAQDVIIEKNPLEKKAKRLDRLKWLPKVYPPLSVLKIEREIKLHPTSTVEFDDEGFIQKVDGISKLKGGDIIPREDKKGFFFYKEDVGNLSFFKPNNTGFKLCTESAKNFIEDKKYSNIIFLEVGDII